MGCRKNLMKDEEYPNKSFNQQNCHGHFDCHIQIWYSRKASPPEKRGIGRFKRPLIESFQGWHAPTTNKQITKIKRQTL
jgi:hypothetical protein